MSSPESFQNFISQAINNVSDGSWSTISEASICLQPQDTGSSPIASSSQARPKMIQTSSSYSSSQINSSNEILGNPRSPEGPLGSIPVSATYIQPVARGTSPQQTQTESRLPSPSTCSPSLTAANTTRLPISQLSNLPSPAELLISHTAFSTAIIPTSDFETYDGVSFLPIALFVPSPHIPDIQFMPSSTFHPRDYAIRRYLAESLPEDPYPLRCRLHF